MEDTMYFGSMIMAVGMTTVFTILALVVMVGKLTVLITNRFAPEAPVMVRQVASASVNEGPKIAAITAAVNIVTQGEGQITEIKKL